jgi:DNA repair protein RadC
VSLSTTPNRWLKRPAPNAARRCPPFKSSTAFRALAPAASFRGSLCFASLFGQKIWHTIFFSSKANFKNIPEAAPKASPSFSVSEKLARYGSSALTGVEHLTLLVGKESVALALIRHFGSFKAMARASFQELRQFLPRRQAESVVAALSMSVIAETEHARSELLDNPESIYRACADMKLLSQEVLRVILLDTRYRHLSTVEITKGSINESLAYPRDIFRPVIGRSAYAFVLAHNHPSGDPAPSEADIRLTRRLGEGARILQINMVDHVIVGQSFDDRPGYFSFKEAGMI